MCPPGASICWVDVGRCRLGLRLREAGAVLTGAQGPGNVDTDVTRVLLAQHVENRTLH